MNVPQLAQGYPSEARSSLPQARHSIASRSCSSVIVTSGRDVVPLDLVDQRRPRDAELDGRSGSVAAMVLQGALDMLALEILQAEWGVTSIAQSRLTIVPNAKPSLVYRTVV